MLNYHTTPQMSAVHHYGSHITHWVVIHFRETAFLQMVIQEPRLLPCYTVSISYTSSPSASISRRRQEYGEMHMEVYDEPALEGYRPVSLLLFWPQFISVATKATGESSNCSPQEGRTIKIVSNRE